MEYVVSDEIKCVRRNKALKWTVRRNIDIWLREWESVCDVAMYSVSEATLPSSSTGSEGACDLSEIE